MAEVGGPPRGIPLKVFIFEVEHPTLTPPRGTLEIVTTDFITAIKLIAEKTPGIHVIRLVAEYWAHLEGGTA